MTVSAAEVHALLRDRGATLGTAESLTGGRLAALLTAVPGSSETYVGGVVSYATAVKTEVLGVPPEVVETYGVVSAECARAMASGARRVLGATYAVSTTGVAGPGPQDGSRRERSTSPWPDRSRWSRWHWSWSGPATVQDRTCEEALWRSVSAILTGEETSLG